MEKFALNTDQISKLRRWKDTLKNENVRWIQRVDEALLETKRLFADSGFREGKNLEPAQLDRFFQLMKTLSSSQALNKRLYELNGIEVFNAKLRDLICGSQSLPDRLEQFLKLKQTGIHVASQILCVAEPEKYPLVTRETLDQLDISEEQRDAMYQQALEEFEIKDPDEWNERVIRILEGLILFRTVKEALALHRYPEVNMVLWRAHQETNEGVDLAEVSLTGVSLEKDLRDWISRNPSKLEKGLKLHDPERPVEYPTKAGRIDVLLEDTDGSLVVVETKKGRPSDPVVGQVLRYMGCLLEEGHKKVRGIILAHEEDSKLSAALRAVPLVKVMFYAVRFEIGNKSFVSDAERER